MTKGLLNLRAPWGVGFKAKKFNGLVIRISQSIRLRTIGRGFKKSSKPTSFHL